MLEGWFDHQTKYFTERVRPKNFLRPKVEFYFLLFAFEGKEPTQQELPGQLFTGFKLVQETA